MNQLKASISPGYRWRLILITVVLLGFGAYCIYDWQIGYPLKVRQYNEYQRLVEEYPNTYPQEWNKVATAEGWSTRTPKRKTDRDVFTQFLMACIVIPIGVFFAFKLVRENMRWVAMDDDGLTANGGKQAAWSSIKALDEARWKSKGIAWVHYDDAGKTRRLLLDDFKMQREPTKAMVDRVREYLHPQDTAADEATTDDDAVPTSEPQDSPNQRY